MRGQARLPNLPGNVLRDSVPVLDPLASKMSSLRKRLRHTLGVEKVQVARSPNNDQVLVSLFLKDGQLVTHLFKVTVPFVQIVKTVESEVASALTKTLAEFMPTDN